jgi:hypothetical protein
MASRKALIAAKKAARKNGTLPSGKNRQPAKQVERNWGTSKPREVMRFAVADLPAGSLVLYKGKPCILMEHDRFYADRASLLFPDGQQWAVPYKWLSMPPE